MFKKILITLIFAVNVSAFTACGSAADTTASVKEIADKIVEIYEPDTMSELTDERFSNYYDLDLSYVDSYSVYIEGSGGFADETAVFKAKDENGVEAVQKSISSRIEQRKKDFDGYNPDELQKIENCLLLKKGNYILFVVSDNNTEAETIFSSFFK